VIKSDLSLDLIQRLEQVHSLARDMRFGQLLATLELLAEDMFGRNLWDIEDNQLLDVMERFRSDLAARAVNVV